MPAEGGFASGGKATIGFLACVYLGIKVGEVAEWLKAYAWRAYGDRKVALGFESRPLRDFRDVAIHYFLMGCDISLRRRV